MSGGPGDSRWHDAVTLADLEAGKDYRLEFRAVVKKNSRFTLVVEEAEHEHEH